jgi:hypothetical protein
MTFTHEQSQRANKGWSTRLGIGHRDNSSPYKISVLQNVIQGQCVKRILWIIRMVGSRRWVGHTWERKEMHTNFKWENLKKENSKTKVHMGGYILCGLADLEETGQNSMSWIHVTAGNKP